MLVSICVANYKQDKFLPELMDSIAIQDYPHIETCVYHDKEGVGSGEAFNRAIAMAKGDIIVLMCADDVFTCKEVISDIVEAFGGNLIVGHVSRYYHQFIDGDKRPVRAWRGNNIYELANNPSGLAFKKWAIMNCKLTNKMFVEAPEFVRQVLSRGATYRILPYDTISVRVHASTARSKSYYQKHWVSSPIEEWVALGGKSLLRDYTSLIQISNYFSKKAVIQEAINFIRLRPLNIISPSFWLFVIISLIIPRCILLKIPEWYRSTFGRWTTRIVERPR